MASTPRYFDATPRLISKALPECAKFNLHCARNAITFVLNDCGSLGGNVV